ncbi:twin transmembrane helix small protein [Niveibacterium sp. 24ML]|uniref:twin transmembrane helix small protein n=1 Tax=Niveibacterium sp. 24ML TaxID=2985512 RepID=UPI0022700B46|nr:twin transmembrane helix small protein [Niveibacterium sp. 24ML]MCX9155534.1 twin transmembrane helix small protein [Niveibacterium sp. 24ML]
MRVVVIVFLILILGSLASALGFLLKDRGHGRRTATALSIRVGLSIALFLILMLSHRFGLINGKL